MIRDPDHEAVLDSPAGRRVVVAPPGTGKTMLSVRIAGRLVHELAPHARVLLLTFSNQARGQLEREARLHLTPAERERVEITNYHRFFLRAVLAYRRALGLGPSPRLVPTGVRKKALLAIGGEVRAHLGERAVDRLAEWRFGEFKDAATPAAELLEKMLTIVAAEQANGKLVFDDLGALFWRLMREHPVVGQAYRMRFPHVIADEHQDASALQDAFVRWVATGTITILCDPMQLIHGYRGADVARIDRHRAEGKEYTLTTPHRWHDSPQAAQWLLAVRARLEGGTSGVVRPGECQIERTADRLGLNGSIIATVTAVRTSLDAGCRTVAVLVPTKTELAEVRRRLCTAGFRPRQVGAANDLEEAHDIVQRLATMDKPRDIALMAFAQFADLAPTLSKDHQGQIGRRLGENGVRLEGCSKEVEGYLKRLEPIYQKGKAAYFPTVDSLISHAASRGLVLPRSDFCRLFEVVAQNPDKAEQMVNGELAALLITRSTSLEQGLFVMTTHQAKGREFDAVILCHAIERHYGSGTAEGRNLFYVAITRGIRRWYVIAPDGAMTGLRSALG